MIIRAIREAIVNDKEINALEMEIEGEKPRREILLHLEHPHGSSELTLVEQRDESEETDDESFIAVPAKYEDSEIINQLEEQIEDEGVRFEYTA